MLNPELQSKFADWRQKAMNDTATPEEMRAAIAALRESRRSAAAAPSKGRTTRAPAKSADDMLGDLMGG